jgi:hypothetical protein
MEALGEDVWGGIGTTDRRAMMAARVKAHVVKNPKVVCNRFNVLCILRERLASMPENSKRVKEDKKGRQERVVSMHLAHVVSLHSDNEGRREGCSLFSRDQILVGGRTGGYSEISNSES